MKFNLSKDRQGFLDLYEGLASKNPHIIYPGKEDNLGRGQWDIFYQFFKREMVGPCLFIGYSFRHETINRPILERLREGRVTLGVLGPEPDEMIKNLSRGQSLPRDKIVEMPAHFGEEEALDKLNEWFSEFSKIKFRNSSHLLSMASQWRNEREKYIRRIN